MSDILLSILHSCSSRFLKPPNHRRMLSLKSFLFYPPSLFPMTRFLRARVTHPPPPSRVSWQVRDHLPRPQPHLQAAAAG